MATQINKEVIQSCLSKLQLPSGQRDISDFISKIIVENGNVVFAIQVDESKITEYNKFKKQAEESLSGLDGIESVKIALTSHITEAKKHNSEQEKISIPGVKKTLVVASGKGGVGKSTIAFNVAVELAKQNLKVGLVDLDVYGPSLSELSGIRIKPVVTSGLVEPHEKFGIKLMSVSYLLGDSDEALAWRGPMVSKMLYQLLNLTNWGISGDLDVLVIDTPPGTGDVHLSLLGKYKIDQALVVTTPHSLALADVRKSINLLEKLHVNVSAIVNNMAFLQTETGVIYPFGKAFTKDKNLKKHKCFEMPISEIISSAAEYSLPVSEMGMQKDGPSQKFTEMASYLKKELKL